MIFGGGVLHQMNTASLSFKVSDCAISIFVDNAAHNGSKLGCGCR